MKKKIRRFLKRHLELRFYSKNSSAFSLIELSVSLVVIAVIIAALLPVISKRLTSSSTVKNRISTECESVCSDGYCAMCYLTPKSCITYTKQCASDEYKNVSECKCEKCFDKFNDPNCTRCSVKGCTQCKDGYYLNNNRKCTICPRGYYCYQSGESSIKQPCKAGTVAPDEGMKACNSCQKSTESTTGNVATNTAMIACTACEPGFYAKDDAQGSECSECPKGYYCPFGKYIPCRQGTANNRTKQTACTSCALSDSATQGTVAPSTAMNLCTSCNNGYYSADTTKECKECPLGYYCPLGKLIECPVGYYQGSKGGSSCLGCVRSTDTQAGNVATSKKQTACTSCNDGYYADIDKQYYTCKACPAGYACPSGKIGQCGIGYYANKASGATKCEACPNGKTSPKGATNVNQCVACATGCSSCSGSSNNCTKCQAGYYLNGSSCAQCKAGTTSPAGSTNVNQCVACTTGCASCISSATQCTACKSSYYLSNSSCKNCTNWHEKCTACNGSGCTACAEGYKVDGTGCKLKFDCEAEGGTIVNASNICFKIVKGSIRNNGRGSHDTVEPDITTICGDSTWRQPSDIELCQILTQVGYSSAKRVHGASFYYVGGTHAAKCGTYVAPDKCKHYSSEYGVSYTYSPLVNCYIHSYGSSNGSRNYFTDMTCIRSMN